MDIEFMLLGWFANQFLCQTQLWLNYCWVEVEFFFWLGDRPLWGDKVWGFDKNISMGCVTVEISLARYLCYGGGVNGVWWWGCIEVNKCSVATGNIQPILATFSALQLNWEFVPNCEQLWPVICSILLFPVTSINPPPPTHPVGSGHYTPLPTSRSEVQ